eukprot:g3090.t1
MITPPGAYPVYRHAYCIPEAFDEVLRNEFEWMRKVYKWDLYHDSDGKGQWNSGKKHGRGFERSSTQVRTLYGVRHTDETCLPVQNPCGLPSDQQWSEKCLKEPFVPMPPATRLLRDLICLGNPSVRSVFRSVVNMEPYYLGIAAFTDYRHSMDSFPHRDDKMQSFNALWSVRARYALSRRTRCELRRTVGSNIANVGRNGACGIVCQISLNIWIVVHESATKIVLLLPKPGGFVIGGKRVSQV